MTMRKLLSLLMVAGIITFFACGTCEKDDANNDNQDATKTEEVQKSDEVTQEETTDDTMVDTAVQAQDEMQAEGTDAETEGEKTE